MAKTGTVAYVNSLSGYATTADDEQIVFSIICNDETSKGSSIQVIDKIADLLVSFSASPT
jgi:D-alanyl-D-alanine carboxypeptidase/D-alanyl-D-alanine-endopeptidase (penicillin-binding protein 4)